MTYKKRVIVSNTQSKHLKIIMWNGEDKKLQCDIISVPDGMLLCSGCNVPIEEGWLIFLDKVSFKRDKPYDICCNECAKSYFPKAIEVKS